MSELNHLGIIPDGNRRYAKEKDKDKRYGHKRGIENFRNTIKLCKEISEIKEITFYTLSTQNFKRDQKELNHLFNLIEKEIERFKDEENNQIQLKVKGDLSKLPKKIREKCKEIPDRDNYEIKVNLLVGYDGRKDIIQASNKINGEITEEKIQENLWVSSEPDLVIRTSGEKRLSGFLTWQTVYSELYFPEVYWPEFNEEELKKAFEEFKKRERRYGE